MLKILNGSPGFGAPLNEQETVDFLTNGNKVRITEIQFKTYLSYNILKEYLVHLLQCDLIEYIEGRGHSKLLQKVCRH